MARCSLLSAVLLAAAAALAVHGLAQAFVPAPQPAPALRGGVSSVAAAVAAAGVPLAASAADELLAYNMAGEWTSTFTAGYFILTLGYTAVAFVSYLVLTKLKII
mmetsp:Transcript_88753/g.230336  ORF Transcript_88753/g.230336 Transcript_88753/m.230336 type:complete len:105 (-) Transcript_88753:131-445(-)